MDSCQNSVPSHHKHKSHVKPRRLTSLKVTVGSRNSRGKISRLTGTGILTRPERNHYFSWHWLSARVRNGYGVFRYSDKELLFLASINGQPAVMADLSGNDADVAQKVSLFLAMNEEPPKNGRLYRLWNILITGKVLLPGYHQQTSAVANLLSAIAANSHCLPYCF